MGETLFNFSQKFSCMVIEAPFSLTEYRFRETFLENKLLFNFYWVSAEHFKTIGEKFPQNLSKPQSTRLRKNFRWKKNMLILTTWFFHKFSRFLIETLLDFWMKKTQQGSENYNLNNRRIVLSKSFFVRKLKLSKFFGNFSEIRRIIFRSLGEVFRRRLSKLHFTGLEKIFEGFYFEVKIKFLTFQQTLGGTFLEGVQNFSAWLSKLHRKRPEDDFK